jgi:aminoglycoside phosphotransferase (APT) family kinase protein
VLRRYLQRNTCAVETALAGRLAGLVPVAEVVAADPDGSAAGEPVMLSRFVPGDLVSTVLGSPGADGLGRATGAVLAAIGTITFPRAGFFSGPDLIPRSAEGPSDLMSFVDRCLRTGNADRVFTPAEQEALRQHASQAGALLGAVDGSRQLVHSDFNPKNLLATSQHGTWSITAVLDWEFAFSGSPLCDIGNMLRFRGELPEAFADGFITGYRDAGGVLPGNWRELSQALDLFALADFLTRPPSNPFFGKAVDILRKRLSS